MNEPVNWGWVVASLAFGWSVINTIYTWYSASQSVTRKEIDELMAEKNIVGNRLTAIERDMKSLPSAENYHKLEIVVTEVRGAIRTMEAEMRPTAISVKRIEDYLINSQTPKARR
jgi:hypothetical protein